MSPLASRVVFRFVHIYTGSEHRKEMSDFIEEKSHYLRPTFLSNIVLSKDMMVVRIVFVNEVWALCFTNLYNLIS